MTKEQIITNYTDALNAPKSPEKKARVIAALAHMHTLKFKGTLPLDVVRLAQSKLK